MTRASKVSPLRGCTFHLVDSFDKVGEFMRWLGERHENDAIAFDTETTGLSPYEPGGNVRLAQFGDTKQGWAIPWEDWRGVVVEALNKWDGDLPMHHSKFDVNWTETHAPGLKVKRHKLHDTLIQARIVDPQGSGALKTLSDIHIDPRASHGQTVLHDAMKANNWTWADVPIGFKGYWGYAAIDTVITAQLHGLFYPKMRPGTDLAAVYDLEMAVSDILGSLERRGARVDVDYCRKMEQYLIDRGQEIREWGTRAHRISIGSGPQLAMRFAALDVPIINTTPTGAPKIDKWQLQIIADPDNGACTDAQQLALMALEMRQVEKTGNTYFKNFADMAIDGIVHPSIHTIGARTGRMSISSPSLQQVPKRDASVRQAFIPRDGNALVTSDYNQIEMRMVAHFSGDVDMISTFETADATGSDFFTEMGRLIYDPAFVKTDKRRGLIKNSLYGMAYGAGVPKMAESAGVPVPKMKLVVSDIETRFPGIRAYMRAVEAQGKIRERDEGQGYVYTRLGRKLTCDTGRVYTLTNYSIQGGAAELFKEGLVRMDMAGFRELMLLPVHDEIVLDAPLAEIPNILREVPDLLQDTSLRVPITADADGPWGSWGAKYV